MKFEGHVLTEVKREEAGCRYKLLYANQEYEVVSSGEQAVLDSLFVRKGQRIEIEGEQRERYLYPRKEKIILDKDV